MERLSNIALLLRSSRNERHTSDEIPPQENEISPAEEEPPVSSLENDNREPSKFYKVAEHILLWESTFNTLSVIIGFNLLYWGIIAYEVRGFTAASGVAFIVILGYNSLEAQVLRADRTRPTLTPQQMYELKKFVNGARSFLDELKYIRLNQPVLYLLTLGTFSTGVWLLSTSVGGVTFVYVICMFILLGPAMFLQVPCKLFSPRELCYEYAAEWENEIEEFLPAATEDNLEVLQRAGDSGEHSPTSRNALSEHQIDPFNEEELSGLRMPSYEDGSADELDYPDLELCPQAGAGKIKGRRGNFESGTSSEEDGDLLKASDDSDSEFEIIDSHEIDNLNDV